MCEERLLHGEVRANDAITGAVHLESRPLFLIMVHAFSLQLFTLWRLLYRADCFYLIHCDSRSASVLKHATRILAWGRRNVAIVPGRPVYWGGWSQVQLQLDAIELTSRLGWKWTHYLPISGQCLPIKSIEKLRQFLTTVGEVSLLELKEPHPAGHPQIVPGASDAFERVEYYYDETAFNNGPRLYGRGPTRIGDIKSPWPQDIQLRCGASWVALDREHAVYAVEAGRGGFWRERFLMTGCPDELFFQTVLANSPFAESTRDFLMWEIDWNRGSPWIWRMPDFDRLQSSQKFFARKFDRRTDSRLICEIARALT